MKRRIGKVGRETPMRTTHSPLYRKIIAVLVDTRKQKGLTQVDLAGRLGKPQSFVSKFENGERRIDAAEFIEICLALQVDALTLLSPIWQAVSVTGKGGQAGHGKNP